MYEDLNEFDYNQICSRIEENSKIELPNFPRGEGQNAFAIFDLNISSENWYHINKLQWTSNQNISFHDSNINHIDALYEHFITLHSNNHIHSEKAALEIYRIVENIHKELINKCNPSLKFGWQVKTKVPDPDCINIKNALYNAYSRNWNAEKNVPFWHRDGKYDDNDYLITFALQGQNTPLYKGDPYKVKMMGIYAPEKNVKITDKRVEMANPGEATLLNLPNCWHAIPCDKSPRLLVLVDAHRCTSDSILSSFLKALRKVFN